MSGTKLIVALVVAAVAFVLLSEREALSSRSEQGCDTPLPNLNSLRKASAPAPLPEHQADGGAVAASDSGGIRIDLRVLAKQGLPEVVEQVAAIAASHTAGTPLVDSRGAIKARLAKNMADHSAVSSAVNAAIAKVKKKTPRENGFATLSMAGKDRLQNFADCVLDATLRDIPGDVVETGVWKGGASIVAKAALLAAGAEQTRHSWLFDSYEGLPGSTREQDVLADKQAFVDGKPRPMDRKGSYSFRGGVDTVRKNMANVVGDRALETSHFVKGYFVDTVYAAAKAFPFEAGISVLRLDGDMHVAMRTYTSTMDVLHALYHRVSPGGFVIIDDYGHWPQCKKAIHDFFEGELGLPIGDLLIKVDYTGYYFQKPSPAAPASAAIAAAPASDAQPSVAEESRLLKEASAVAARKGGKGWAKGMGHVGEVPLEMTFMRSLMRGIAPAAPHVCEVGFNAGHSAIVWLSSSPRATYTAFDLGNLPWSEASVAFIKETFGERFEYRKGRAGDGPALVQYAAEVASGAAKPCDVVSVDGGHDYKQSILDFRNGAKIAASGASLFADDVSKKSFPGVVKSWAEILQGSLVTSPRCEADPTPVHGYYKRWCAALYP